MKESVTIKYRKSRKLYYSSITHRLLCVHLNHTGQIGIWLPNQMVVFTAELQTTRKIFYRHTLFCAIWLNGPKNKNNARRRWRTSFILALGRQRPADHKLKLSLSYIMSLRIAEISRWCSVSRKQINVKPKGPPNPIPFSFVIGRILQVHRISIVIGTSLLFFVGSGNYCLHI